MKTQCGQLKHKQDKSGFTLAELVISLSVLSIFLTVAMATIMFITKSTYSLSNYNSMSHQTRLATNMIGMDVRSASNVVTATSSNLKVETENPDGSKNVVTYTYNSNDGTLSRKMDASANVVIVRNLTSFKFNYYTSANAATSKIIEMKKIEAQFDLMYSVGSREQKFDSQSAKFLLRNHRAT